MAHSDLAIIELHFANRPFAVHEAGDLGIARHSVYRLRDRGRLEVRSRGVMALVDRERAVNSKFAALAVRVPNGTICLKSGLSYWGLSDWGLSEEPPGAIDLAVRRGAHWPRIDMPATKVHRFAAETFSLERVGLETSAGEPFWIYSAARCVVDSMRLAHNVGRGVALTALGRYVRQAGSEPLALTALAHELGGERRLREALEVILA